MGVGIALGVLEIDLGDPHQVRGIEAVAALILIGEVGKGPGPEEGGVLEFMAGPGRRPEVLRRLLAGHIAHLLQTHDAGQVISAGLQLGGGRQDGDAA